MRTEEPQNAKTSSSSPSHQMWCGGKLFFYCGNRNDHWWPALSFSSKVPCNFMSNEAPELSHHYQIAKGRSWSAAVLFCTRHQNTGTPLRPLPGLIFFTAEEQGRRRRRRRKRSTDQIRFLGVETEIWIWDWTKHGSPGMAGSVTNQREEPLADDHHAWTTRILVVCVFPTCQYNAGSVASVAPMNVLMYSVCIMYLYLCVYVLCLFMYSVFINEKFAGTDSWKKSKCRSSWFNW